MATQKEPQTDRDPNVLPLWWPAEQEWHRGWNKRQLLCPPVSQRPAESLLMLLYSPDRWCGPTPSGRGIVPLIVPCEDCREENTATYTAKCEFSILRGLWLHKTSLFWKSWTSIIPRGITTHGHPTGYYDGPVNFLWNLNYNIDYCPNTKYSSTAIQEQDEQRWCEILYVIKAKWYTKLSVMLGRPARYSPTEAKRCIDFKITTEKTCLCYWNKFTSPCGILFNALISDIVLLQWENQVH